MNAYEIPALRFSLPAGAAVARHLFVAVNSSSKGIHATATTPVIGVSMNQCDAVDEVLEIADGIVMVTASAAIAAGVAVESTADGKAVTYGSGLKVGVAITPATAAGDLIAVKLV